MSIAIVASMIATCCLISHHGTHTFGRNARNLLVQEEIETLTLSVVCVGASFLVPPIPPHVRTRWLALAEPSCTIPDCFFRPSALTSPFLPSLAISHCACVLLYLNGNCCHYCCANCRHSLLYHCCMFMPIAQGGRKVMGEQYACATAIVAYG